MKNRPLRSLFSCYKALFAFGVYIALCIAFLPQAKEALAAVQQTGGDLSPEAVPTLVPKAVPTALSDSAEKKPEVLRSAPTRPSAPGEPGSWSIFHQDDKSTVSIYYPHIDNPRIDNELSAWADVRLRTFVSGVACLGEGTSHYSMDIDYTISFPSPQYISIVFRISTETGGMRPDLGLTTFSYDLNTGKKLGYKDIFGDCEGLLAFISEYARNDLMQRLGRWERDLVLRGTAPQEANFAHFSLAADGLHIFFPPYQVASSSLGEQSVTIPLEKLLPYKPKVQVWGLQP